MLFTSGRTVLGKVLRFGALGALALAAAGCLQTPTVDCGNGLICADGQVCFQASATTAVFCATQNQIAACTNDNGAPKPDGTLCGDAGSLDRCANGFCQPSLCGNGEIDTQIGEACDGDDVSLLQSCSQRGYDTGVVSCAACDVDTDTCLSYCGDGVADADEECDGIDVNAQLNFACSAFGRAGTVTCDSQCRLDASACASPWRSERIITLPPLSGAGSVVAAFVVDAAEAWVVAQAGSLSTIIWWNGDRWLRPKLLDATQRVVDEIAETCLHVWAMHGAAFIGCESGLMLQMNAVADPLRAKLDGPVVGIWGLSATDVWAATEASLWHFDGASWVKQIGADLTANKALSGDADDVFVLTEGALYRWNRQQASWLMVRRQSLLSPFERLQVHNENAIWLADATGSKISQYSVEPDWLTTTDLYPHTFAVGAANRFLTIDPTDKKRVEQWQATRFVGERRDLGSVQSTEVGVRDADFVAAGNGAAWAFGKDFQEARVGLLGDLQPVFVGGVIPASVFEANPSDSYTVAQSRTGALYFSGGPNARFVYRMDVHKPSAVLQGVLGSPVVDLAPVSAGADEVLALTKNGKVIVLTKNEPTQDLISVGTPIDAKAIWSDGQTGFAMTTLGLLRYEAGGNWTPLTLTPASRPLLTSVQRMTGGSLNNSYTLWLTPPNAAVVQVAKVEGNAVTVSDVTLPAVGDDIAAVWSNGFDLWLARKSSTQPYLAYWNGTRWTNFVVPNPADRIVALWSNGPGAIWVSLNNGALLRFDGSTWQAAFTGALTKGTLLSQTPVALWALLDGSANPLVEIQAVNPPLTGGFCPAQQELFCRDSGHGVTAGPRSISTIVGGRYGNSNYVLNSPILGDITFAGNLPPEVEAVWALPDPSGTCPAGAPLAFASNGTTASATRTLGRSRYFLTLRPRDATDTTEYPVTLEYSCHRAD